MTQPLDPTVWGGLFNVSPRRQPAVGSKVVGFRLCTMVEDEAGQLHLTSTGVGNHYWLPGINTAHCVAQRRPSRIHRAPVQTCTCGLYAGRDVAKLLRVLGPPVAPMVLCGIQAGGRIVVHEWGFRAEDARIVAISAELPSRVLRDPSGQVIQVRARRGIEPWAAEELAQCYGAMLIDLDGMAGALQQFGDFIEEEEES